MTTYDAFLQSKLVTTTTAGLTSYTLPERLFPFQRHVTGWALERGRAALFLDTGLGKALDSTTRVLTPVGYQEIGQLKPGDCVFGVSGQPITVLGVYPQGR